MSLHAHTQFVHLFIDFFQSEVNMNKVPRVFKCSLMIINPQQVLISVPCWSKLVNYQVFPLLLFSGPDYE